MTVRSFSWGYEGMGPLPSVIRCPRLIRASHLPTGLTAGKGSPRKVLWILPGNKSAPLLPSYSQWWLWVQCLQRSSHWKQGNKWLAPVSATMESYRAGFGKSSLSWHWGCAVWCRWSQPVDTLTWHCHLWSSCQRMLQLSLKIKIAHM